MKIPVTPTAMPTTPTTKPTVEIAPVVLAESRSDCALGGQRPSPLHVSFTVDAVDSVMTPVMVPTTRPTPATPKPMGTSGLMPPLVRDTGGGVVSPGGAGIGATAGPIAPSAGAISSSRASPSESERSLCVGFPLTSRTTTCAPGSRMRGALIASGGTPAPSTVTLAIAPGGTPFTRTVRDASRGFT